MQQANIINMNHNRSTALERSVKITGLNRFYGIPTSPSASIMAQNIQLFGPREGFLKSSFRLKSSFYRPLTNEPIVLPFGFARIYFTKETSITTRMCVCLPEGFILILCSSVVYTTRRFMFGLALLFVYMFSILITLLGEEGAGLCAYRALVC